MSDDDDAVRVLAVDPGTGTGLAWATFTPAVMAHESVRRSWEIAQNEGMWSYGGTMHVDCHAEQDGIDEIMAVVRRVKPHVLLIEDFILLPPKVLGERFTMDRAGLSPVRITAAIEREVHLRSVLRWWADLVVEKQMPNERMVASTDRLKAWGLWRTPKEDGGKDVMAATQHLVVYGRKISW